jgi:hypothetical protein
MVRSAEYTEGLGLALVYPNFNFSMKLMLKHIVCSVPDRYSSREN